MVLHPWLAGCGWVVRLLPNYCCVYGANLLPNRQIPALAVAYTGASVYPTISHYSLYDAQAALTQQCTTRPHPSLYITKHTTSHYLHAARAALLHWPCSIHHAPSHDHYTVYTTVYHLKMLVMLLAAWGLLFIQLQHSRAHHGPSHDYYTPQLTTVQHLIMLVMLLAAWCSLLMQLQHSRAHHAPSHDHYTPQ